MQYRLPPIDDEAGGELGDVRDEEAAAGARLVDEDDEDDDALAGSFFMTCGLLPASMCGTCAGDDDGGAVPTLIDCGGTAVGHVRMGGVDLVNHGGARPSQAAARPPSGGADWGQLQSRIFPARRAPRLCCQRLPRLVGTHWRASGSFGRSR